MYHCVCEMVASIDAAIETHNKYFLKQNNILEVQEQMVLSMESASWKIYGDRCTVWSCQLNNIWRWVQQV
jgi:hypothetical protein